LLFTSSTSVYAQIDGSVVNECSPAEPRHPKGEILRDTENLISDRGGIVVRLGGIHGPGRSFFLTRFLEGAVGDRGDRFINQVHRDDIVLALLLLAERRADCRGQIFNVVGDKPIKASDAYAWLQSRLGDIAAATSAPARAGKRGESNKQVSNRKLRALGWQPRYPNFEVAMSESILPSFGF
jgi:nucleoside-diphosphate-sugar epimerase